MSLVDDFVARWNGQYVWLLGTPSSGNRECVALFWRWNTDYNNAERYAAAGAQDLWKGYTSWDGYDRILPTQDQLPGDWFLWDGYSGAYPNGGSGHVAMFLSDNGDGTGMFFSQNPNPAIVMRLSYAGVLGYLRPKRLHGGGVIPIAPNQRWVSAGGAIQRIRPNRSAAVVRQVPGGTIEEFTGYVHGEYVESGGIASDVWFVDAAGACWVGGFDDKSTNGLNDVTPVRANPAPNQRYAGANGNVNQRATASTSADVVRTIPAGSLEAWDGFVHGESIDGNDVWFKDHLGYAWSGAFEDAGTHDLPDVTETARPEPLPTQRYAGGAVVNQRATPYVNGVLVRSIPAGSLEQWDSFVHGGLVTVNGFSSDVWFKDHLGYAWCGGFEDPDTHDLPESVDETGGGTVEPPTGSPVLNVVDVNKAQPGFKAADVADLDAVYIAVTAGMDYLNQHWRQQLDDARAADKPVALYHIRAVGSVGTPREEADRFLDTVEGVLDGKTPIILDWEQCDESDVAYAFDWLEYARARSGITAWVYMNLTAANTWNWSAVASRYPLIVAQYPYSATVGFLGRGWTCPVVRWWDKPVMWQYSSGGQLAGYKGNLDLNVFYGDRAAWEAAGTRATVPPVQPPTSVTVTLNEDDVEYLTGVAAFLTDKLHPNN